MTKYLASLKGIREYLVGLSANKNINPKIADDLIKIGQHKIRLFLEDLFTNEYVDLIESNNFSSFLLYSYKSYYGEIPAQRSDVNRVYRRRLNLFHKGGRWTDNTGRIFYEFLDKINDRFEDTPINLFGELCCLKSIRHLEIRVESGAPDALQENTVVLPDTVFLANLNLSSNIAAPFANYISYLSRPNFDEYYKSFAKIEEELRSLDLDMLLTECKAQPQLMRFVDHVCRVFGLDEAEQIEYVDRIIKTMFSYQFNDLPFNLNLFFPVNKEFLSTMMITTANPGSFCESDIQFFQELTNDLAFLDEYEKQIVEETRRNNESYIIWKKIYEREYDKLFSFMKSVENICFSICRQHGISFSYISGRVKSFDSVYNKIFFRSNEKTNGANLYRDAIDEPHFHYHRIFEVIKDLAGVRVVLLFESDLRKIRNIFAKIAHDGEIGSTDLILKDEKFYEKSMDDPDQTVPPELKEKKWGYRSLHLTVKPGLDRLKLAEFRNLRDVQCEVQFRTVLAHAWADVNHDLEYKNREVYREIFPEKQDFLKDDFVGLSRNLYDNDQLLNKIKELSDEVSLE